MVYKVFYQEIQNEAPVREKTKTLFINADSERDVREKLAEKPFNIEFITKVEGAFLEYEQQDEDYKVLEIGK